MGMLVLTRRTGEVIEIDVPGQPVIKITILGVKKYGQVSVGIDAPRDVAVNREEIADRIRNGK